MRDRQRCDLATTTTMAPAVGKAQYFGAQPQGRVAVPIPSRPQQRTHSNPAASTPSPILCCTNKTQDDTLTHRGAFVAIQEGEKPPLTIHTAASRCWVSMNFTN